MGKIKIAIIGMGNCASSLLQGIEYYKNMNSENNSGVMHWEIGGFKPSDIEVVAAFDVDKRKVGKDVNKAIFEKPNCTLVFCENMPDAGTKVSMGRISDGVSEHMSEYSDDYTFVLSDAKEPTKEEVVKMLVDSGTEILINYLPVGSQLATEFYAECALEANVAFINSIPVFIASNKEWAEKFKKKNLPIIGDDIKAQIGATITHRVLVDLFKKRGVKLERSYQLNAAGNTDFLNMLNRKRLASKKESKTEAVQSAAPKRLDERNIHVGPSDYIPWQNDNKICFIRMEGKMFGDANIDIELRLSVEDSPNSAGVVIDAIRCCKLALDRGIGGVLKYPSAFFCKHPMEQYPDDVAYTLLEEFINKK